MRNPIKVAYIIGGLPFGGVEVWLLDLVMALQGDNRITPYVINLSGTGDLMAKYAKEGIEVLSTGKSTRDINTHRLDTLFSLRTVLRRINPDVIHTLHFSGDYFGRLASLGMGKPVFTHLRNIKSERKHFRRFANKVLSYATTCYFSVSREVAETVRRDHNVAGRPSRVLYNAVMPEKLDVAPFDLEARYGLRGRTVIGVGRLVKQKNFDRLITAFAHVNRRIPDVSLLILGDGKEMHSLQTLVHNLGLERCVCLPGFVDNSDIPHYLKAAYVLAMPSDYEGLPITHVEGLFCGLPAVISEHVPSIEIAAEASLVCTTEVDDIANKLFQILDNEALHARLSEAALGIAPEYAMNRYIEKLVTFYREFL